MKSAAAARVLSAQRQAPNLIYTATLRVDYYAGKHTAVHQLLYPEGMHFGGDEQLALGYLDILNGKPSCAPLADGLASAAAHVLPPKNRPKQICPPLFFTDFKPVPHNFKCRNEFLAK